MPVITKIIPQKRRENRRNVHLDGRFAFGCNVNVVAKFRLREGLSLTDGQVSEIEAGEVRQECFDHAIRFLEMRPHGRRELSLKLARHEHGAAVIEGVLEDLTRLGYLDDGRFARELGASMAKRRQFGKRRTILELGRRGIARETAERAMEQVYEGHDDLATARELIRKKAPAMKRLDARTARRRLTGQLLRRGFEYETIKALLDEELPGE